MKNSINVLICSLFFIISYGCIAQKRANRYVKRNLDAPIISYGDSNTYCRGLYQRDGFVFLGNSDGAVYRYDIIKQKSKLILKMKFPATKKNIIQRILREQLKLNSCKKIFWFHLIYQFFYYLYL